VYADWLQENDMPGHAEVVRRHVQTYNEGVHGHLWESAPKTLSAAHASYEPYQYVRINMRHPEGKGTINWFANFPTGAAGAADKHRLMKQLDKEGATVTGDYDRGAE
jgi:hypothetical protein